MNNKPPVILIVGPTGTGKTKLSVALAQRVGGEIISCDSMQIYRGMDIGTAKVTEEEKQGVPHYMTDIKNPGEPYSVGDFVADAKICGDKILSHGKKIIMVGGTGLYADSFVRGIDFTGDSGADPEIRRELEEYAKEKGAPALHQKLREVDPESADSIHPNNIKRVVRAIEYFRKTGETISSHKKKTQEKPSLYDYCYIGLTRDRDELYERIDKRVDIMMNEGLVPEVMKLWKAGVKRSSTAVQALGYKEIYDYIHGKSTLSEATRIIKRDSRHYAKRQLTWFGRNKEINWLNLSHMTFEEALEKAVEITEKRGK